MKDNEISGYTNNSFEDPRITRANLALLGMLSRYLGEVNEEEPITSRLWVPVSGLGSESETHDAGREENEWAEHGIKEEENWDEGPEEEENSHNYEDENSHNEEASYDKESALEPLLRKEGGNSEEYSEEESRGTNSMIIHASQHTNYSNSRRSSKMSLTS